MGNARIAITVLVASTFGFQCADADTIALNSDMDSCLAVEFVVAEQTTAALEDTIVDWSGLDTDLYGHPMDPAADVQAVAVVGFLGLTHEDVVHELNCGTLSQADVAWFSRYYPQSGETVARLGEFDHLDPADGLLPMEPGTHFLEGTWGFWIQRDDVWEELGLALVESAPNARARSIHLSTDSASLVIHRAGGMAPIPGVASSVVWLDWSVWAATDGGSSCGVCPGSGAGGEPRIELIRLARYDSTVEQPDLDMITFDALAADVVYEAEHPTVEGARYELTSLLDEDGAAFPGFDGEGTWLLGLFGEHRTYWRPHFLGRIEKNE